MPISMECPSCMNTFTLPDELAGHKSKCPECQFGLFVPRGATTVDPTTSPASPNTPAPTTANKPALSAAPTNRRPDEVAAVTPAPSKRARAVRKNALATTPAASASGENPFDFDAQPTVGPRRRRRHGGWGMILLVVFALFALGALLLVGGTVAWYFWKSKPPVVAETTKKEEPPSTEPTKKTDDSEAPKKVTPKEEAPKKEAPKNPVGKPIRDPILDAPDPMGKPKPTPDPKPTPTGKQARLLLSPIPSQTVKPGDKVLLAVSVVREECKGPVVISALTPAAGISVAPPVTLPEDIDRASLQVTVDPNLAAGTYRLSVVAALNTLNPVTDNKVFELKVEKAAAPVVVKPPTTEPGKPPLQIVNAKVHMEGHAYTANTGAVEAVALSGDAKWAVSGSADGTVNLWELDKGQVATLFSEPDGTSISAVALSPDGKWAASGDTQGAIRLHNLEKKETKVLQTTHKLPAKVVPESNRVNALEFSLRGDLLVAADQRGLGSYNVATGKQVLVANVVDSPCLHFAPDGTHVYALSGKSIAVVDVRRGALLRYLGNQQGQPTDFSATCFACFGPKQELIALVRHDKQVELQRINEKTGQTQKLADFETPGDSPLRIAVAAKAGYAVTSDPDGLIRGWELDTGKELFKVPGHKGEVHGLAVSADGRRCVSGGADRTFRILDLTNIKDGAPKSAP